MKKLMLLIMLFILTVVVADRVSAQNTCSKKSDGKQVKVEFANATGKPFTINPVDEKCREQTSNKQISPDEIFYGVSHNGSVFRVREVGTNRLLQEIVIDRSKPVMIVQTDLDNSNARVIYLDRDEDSDSKPGNDDTAEKQTFPSNSDTVQTASSESNSSSDEKNIVTHNSFGKVKIGMTISDASKTLGTELARGNGYEDGCYYVEPKQRYKGVLFMVTNGTIARIDIKNKEYATDKGAKIGDTEAKIKQLYKGIEVFPQKYDEKKHDMEVYSDDKQFLIIFETDGNRVTGFRVGKAEEAAYVEGCS